MWNIYLKVFIEINWRFQNFDFLSLKHLSPVQFLGNYSSCRYHWNLKHLLATKKSDIWEQNSMWLFCYFNFERNYDGLNSKSPCFLVSKNINFNKNETESKIENPTHIFRKTNFELAKEKKVHVSQRLFCSKEIFLTFAFCFNV